MKKRIDYSTKDLAEAAALMVLGQSLTEINREGDICWFVFEDERACQELSHKYFFDNLLVKARDYQEAMKRLKRMVFAKG